jgi:hypothetical protein
VAYFVSPKSWFALIRVINSQRFSVVNTEVGDFHSLLAALLRYPTHCDELIKARQVAIWPIFNGLLAFYFGATSAFVPVTTEHRSDRL